LRVARRGGGETGLDLLARPRGRGGGLGDGLHEPGAHVVEELEIESPLRPEMLVQHGLRDTGGLGDVVHRRDVEPVGGEGLECHVEKLAPTLGRGQAGAAPRVGAVGSRHRPNGNW